MAFYNGPRSIGELTVDIIRLRATISTYEKMIAGKKTLIAQLEAEQSVRQQLEDARANWPEFKAFEPEILAVLQKDSDRVAAALRNGWVRPYAYDMKAAYNEVLAPVKAKREAEAMAVRVQAAKDAQHKAWLTQQAAYRYLLRPDASQDR